MVTKLYPGYFRRARQVGLNIRYDTRSDEHEAACHGGVTYSEVIAEQHSRVQASNYIQLSVRGRSNGERANGCMLMSDDVDGSLLFSPVPETDASIRGSGSKRVRRDWSRDDVMDRSRALLELGVYIEMLQLATKVQSEEGHTEESSPCAKIPH